MTAAAILGAGAMIAITLAFMLRWEMAPDRLIAYRLDRWTGNVVACTPAVLPSVYGSAVPVSCDVTATEEMLRKSE